MADARAIPTVSIGMPVFNGERTIRAALDSLLAQSFADFELIISDNASTDATPRICREYAERDRRIRLVQQSADIGAISNFKAVLDEAQGEYFMWAACDDTRSPDFIEVNLRFLSEHDDYVASASPNGFEDRKETLPPVTFAMDGDVFDRYRQFFNNCFSSQGIFFALIRTKVLHDCGLIDEIFPGRDWLGMDWAVILYLASKGRINRASEGYTSLGGRGISSRPDIFRVYSVGVVERLFPFYRLTLLATKITRGLPFRRRAAIASMLARLNVFVPSDPIRRVIYYSIRPVYRLVVKSRKIRGR